MSSNDPVNPGGVPVFTGNAAVLEAKVKALSGDGTKIASAAGEVHSTFGGLRAFYKAPEAEQLFATTRPVVQTATAVSSEVSVIAGALDTYASDIRPLVARLNQLRQDAADFRAKVDGDDTWNEDGDLVDENLARRNEIAEVWAAFQEAERACHAKIVALVGGHALKADDGSNKKHMYGYDAEALKQAESLPWGDAVQESTRWYQVWEHAWDFGTGFVVDGLGGTLAGLGTLVGVDGWDAAKQAWTGLAKLATGVALLTTPLAGIYLAMPDDKLPSWLRESRTALKETGKALVAWDQWGEKPGRAAGAATFNVVTTIFTGGAGGAVSGAGKAGAAAKAISLAGKAGRAVDPMTYVFQGVGAGLTKIGDVMAGLKGMGNIEVPKINEGAFSLPDGSLMRPDGTIQLPKGTAIPEGATRLPDGNTQLPEGTVTLPPGTVKLPADGPPQYMDPAGNLYNSAGDITQRAEDAKTDVVDNPKVEAPAKVEIREPVAVGARGGDDATRVNSDISAPAGAGDNLPTGRAGDNLPGGGIGDNMPTNNLDNTPRGGASQPGGTPPATGAGHTDAPPTGGTHTDSPGTGSGGHQEHPSAGGALPETPGTGGVDDATRAGDDAGGNTPGSGSGHAPDYDTARQTPGSQRTPEERAAISREHVRLANEDPAWFKDHYNILGRRISTRLKVDDQILPQLLEREGGGWMNADDVPFADPEKYRLEPVPKPASSVNADDLQHLDEVAARRRAGMDLTAAEKAHGATPTAEAAEMLADAQKSFTDTVGPGVANNSKLGEALGEEAARRHVVQQVFPDAKEITDLPQTANGSKQFDQLWRDKDGNLVIVEAKGPTATLDWRLGNGELDMRTKVKQGTIEYVRTIVADMESRALLSPKDGKLAAEIRAAMKNKTLQYVLVQAAENTGKYAGAELKYFKIF